VDRRVARIFVRGGHDDGGTEGPERGAEARSAEAPRGLGRGAVAPPQYEGLGA